MIKDEELTEWFREDVKPIRPGVYEVQVFIEGKRYFRFWNGVQWFYGGFDANQAFENNGYAVFRIVPLPWRGITQEAYLRETNLTGRVTEMIL